MKIRILSFCVCVICVIVIAPVSARRNAFAKMIAEFIYGKTPEFNYQLKVFSNDRKVLFGNCILLSDTELFTDESVADQIYNNEEKRRFQLLNTAGHYLLKTAEKFEILSKNQHLYRITFDSNDIRSDTEYAGNKLLETFPTTLTKGFINIPNINFFKSFLINEEREIMLDNDLITMSSKGIKDKKNNIFALEQKVKNHGHVIGMLIKKENNKLHFVKIWKGMEYIIDPSKIVVQTPATPREQATAFEHGGPLGSIPEAPETDD